jgi:hypothetical protein
MNDKSSAKSDAISGEWSSVTLLAPPQGQKFVAVMNAKNRKVVKYVNFS